MKIIHAGKEYEVDFLYHPDRETVMLPILGPDRYFRNVLNKFNHNHKNILTYYKLIFCEDNYFFINLLEDAEYVAVKYRKFKYASYRTGNIEDVTYKFYQYIMTEFTND